MTGTPEERFWAKVEITEGCWLWTASRTPDGYGKLKVAGRWGRAHRVAYEQLVGPIPDGLQIDHLCRVRHCVNPAHMEPVTCRENLMRGDTVTARNAAKTHCPQGHPLEAGNLGLSELRRGKRACLICSRERTREWMRAWREASMPPTVQ